jgi:hypothetical protein
MVTVTGILQSRFQITEAATRQTEKMFSDLVQRLDKIPSKRK